MDRKGYVCVRLENSDSIQKKEIGEKLFLPQGLLLVLCL